MRIRSIKPEFFGDQIVAAWGPLTRIIYVGLWCMADDCGRFQADVDSVRAEVAKKDAPKDVERALRELAEAGKIATYDTDGQRFGVVVNFWHQKVDRPAPPQWPCPPDEVWQVIIEKAAKNKRFRQDVAPRLHRLAADASSSVRRLIDDVSSPSRVRASEQGSEGARERGSEGVAAAEAGTSDEAHSILVGEVNLRSLTYEQDLKARRAAGVELRDPRLVEWAKAAVIEAAPFSSLDDPGKWWQAQLEIAVGHRPAREGHPMLRKIAAQKRGYDPAVHGPSREEM